VFIDEAHLLPDWVSFRNPCMQVQQLRAESASATFVLLSATMPAHVRRLTCGMLGVTSTDLVSVPFHRPRMRYEAVEVRGGAGATQVASELVRLCGRHRTLVFWQRRDDAVTGAAALRLVLHGQQQQQRWVGAALGGGDQAETRACVEAFQRSRDGVLCATSVLSVGYDDASLARVIVVGVPAQLHQLVQMAHRAGRSGPGTCIIVTITGVTAAAAAAAAEPESRGGAGKRGEQQQQLERWFQPESGYCLRGIINRVNEPAAAGSLAGPGTTTRASTSMAAGSPLRLVQCCADDPACVPCSTCDRDGSRAESVLDALATRDVLAHRADVAADVASAIRFLSGGGGACWRCVTVAFIEARRGRPLPPGERGHDDARCRRLDGRCFLCGSSDGHRRGACRLITATAAGAARRRRRDDDVDDVHGDGGGGGDGQSRVACVRCLRYMRAETDLVGVRSTAPSARSSGRGGTAARARGLRCCCTCAA
jgi:hypothetical protein